MVGWAERRALAKVARFEDLDVWQLARAVTRKIYVLTRKGGFLQDFGLRDQICRAAVSILSNIAEGFERRTDKSMLQFLTFAKGSAGEVRAQLYIALDIGYISQDEFDSVYADIVRIGKMLTNLVQYYRNDMRPYADPPIRRSDHAPIRRSDHPPIRRSDQAPIRPSDERKERMK